MLMTESFKSEMRLRFTRSGIIYTAKWQIGMQELHHSKHLKFNKLTGFWIFFQRVPNFLYLIYNF